MNISIIRIRQQSKHIRICITRRCAHRRIPNRQDNSRADASLEEEESKDRSTGLSRQNVIGWFHRTSDGEAGMGGGRATDTAPSVSQTAKGTKIIPSDDAAQDGQQRETYRYEAKLWNRWNIKTSDEALSLSVFLARRRAKPLLLWLWRPKATELHQLVAGERKGEG